MFRSGFGKEQFLQRHLLIFLVEDSPFLKTLPETGSSVAADLGMVQTDKLESVICLGLHDSDVTCYQAIVSSVFISVTFQSVTTLKVLMRRGYSGKCWVRGFRCLGSGNLEDASLDLLPIEGLEPLVSSDLVQKPIQETVDPRRYCQIAVAVVMVELKAVYAVEAAHRRQLLSVGSLQSRTMLIPGCREGYGRDGIASETGRVPWRVKRVALGRTQCGALTRTQTLL